MNKEYTPLEAFKQIFQTLSIACPFTDESDIYRWFCTIETALKENSELKTRNYELLKESENFYNERNEYKKAFEIINETECCQCFRTSKELIILFSTIRQQ